MIFRGFYVIKDAFFEDYPDPYLKGNKRESRPHYYCFKGDNGLYWLIPMSSRYEKYQRIIDERSKRGKPTDFLYVTKLDNGKMNAFLIGDMFPVIPEYIQREYTVNGNQLRVTRESIGNQIEKQAKKVLKLLKLGYKFSPTQPEVFKIEKSLLDKLESIKELVTL